MTWLEAVTAVYGEPLVRVDEPVRREGAYGRSERRCWAWFPGKRNHYISIDRYPGRPERWVVTVGSHRPEMPSVEWTTRTEPDDDLMRYLFLGTGFLNTAIEVAS